MDHTQLNEELERGLCDEGEREKRVEVARVTATVAAGPCGRSSSRFTDVLGHFVTIVAYEYGGEPLEQSDRQRIDTPGHGVR